MDANARLQLQKMINENNVLDQTSLIRELKHSVILREDINNLLRLKSIHKDNLEQLQLDGMLECNFLFTYYTDIFNKIKKDEIDINILFKFLDVLKKIEDGELDQHEGSYEVGSLLKKIYIDSALKKAEKLNMENENKEVYKGPEIDITWKQFKKINRK